MKFFITAPEGDPSRFAVAFAQKMSSKAGELPDKVSYRHFAGRGSSPYSSEHFDPVSWSDLVGRLHRRIMGGRAQLQ